MIFSTLSFSATNSIPSTSTAGVRIRSVGEHRYGYCHLLVKSSNTVSYRVWFRMTGSDEWYPDSAPEATSGVSTVSTAANPDGKSFDIREIQGLDEVYIQVTAITGTVSFIIAAMNRQV